MAREDNVGSEIGMQDIVVSAPFENQSVAGGCLCQDVVVLNGPFRVPGGVLDLRIAQGGIAHTQNAKLGRHAVQIQANTVEIRVRCTMGKGGRDCVLRRRRIRHGLTGWIQQNGIDVRKGSESSKKGRKLGSSPRPDGAGK